MESRFVEARGVRMRWEEVGEGPPVVFVHGIPTSPRLWRRVVPLVSGARCLAWEMVGYGASIPEGRDRDISVARQAGYLADWMREVGLAEGAVIVGHDLGGGVAQILAANDPSLVRGLVLTNSICYDSWPVAPVKAIRALGPVLARLPEAAFRLIYGGFMLAGHDERAVARESTAEHLPYYAGSDGTAALVRQARSLDVDDTLEVSDRIPEIDVPARLVWGAADRFLPIGYGYRLAYELGAPIERVEAGKHFVPEDHPEPVAAAVGAVLEETGAGRAWS
ncbi:MAG: alpha/beta fold hydrolase [Actinomycetota bacterium]|nr:alpha/beta fold hydrolase [Actinomycetota bacterium]